MDSQKYALARYDAYLISVYRFELDINIPLLEIIIAWMIIALWYNYYDESFILLTDILYLIIIIIITFTLLILITVKNIDYSVFLTILMQRRECRYIWLVKVISSNLTMLLSV